MKTIYILSTLLVVTMLAGCGSGESRQASAEAAPRIPVTAVAVQSQQWPAVYETTGTVRARVTAVISSKVSGYVDRVTVQQGDHVSAGQVLVVLDARDLNANLRGVEAGYNEVESAIPEADSAIAAAQANLQLAQVTFHRVQDLAAKQSVTQQELDEVTARLKAAEANRDMARARRAQLDSKLKQVSQQRTAAAIMRDYARIAAPFAGVITAKSVEPGNLAMPGVPLLTMERAGGFRLEAAVDESKLPALRLGDRVRVAVEAGDCEGTARVSEIVPAVDAASRSYIAKIDLPPVDDSGRPLACAALRSGMYGRADFTSGARDVITVPPTAIVERGQLQSVFVAEGGQVHVRLVTLGEHRGGSVEVLSGLSGGESVVSPVPPNLADGASVEVRQ
jgi:membrane fusion protein, multidrug efflux system